ncbi:MAG: serine protease [Deltaproteobacteria bacterium]|nr:serine protease [Deltaproteobacteria bacterium]
MRAQLPLTALFFGLAALAAVAGCNGPAPQLGTSQQRIIQGTPDTTAAHQAVVALLIRRGAKRSLCSGTLITERVVLTAAHCLNEVPDPAAYRVGFGDDLRVDAAMTWRDVEAVRFHPGYNSQDKVNDIGLLRMAEAAPAGVSPISYLPRSLAIVPADVGASADVVGFGEDEQQAPGVKRHLTRPIASVCEGSACLAGGGQCPANSIGFTQENGGACSGDSGGPALVLRSGTEYVAGVTSFGDLACLDFGCSTKVDAFQDFIEVFLNEAEKPQGAVCAAAIECSSGFCADGVCCNSKCDLGSCDACAVAAGAPVDGRCVLTNAACDDGLRCTVSDACANGVCHGQPLDCSAPGACVGPSSCDPATGSCRPFPLLADGAACNDPNPCTAVASCIKGECVSTPKECPGGTACQEPICNPQNGACELRPLADGAPCEVGTCLMGTCTTPAVEEQAVEEQRGCGCASGAEALPVLGLLSVLSFARSSARRKAAPADGARPC